MTHLQNFAASNPGRVWTLEQIASHVSNATEEESQAANHVSGWISEQGLDFPLSTQANLVDEHERPVKKLVLSQLCSGAATTETKALFIALDLSPPPKN